MSNIRLCETRFKTSHAQVIEQVACDLECKFQQNRKPPDIALKMRSASAAAANGSERTAFWRWWTTSTGCGSQVVCEEASMGTMAREERASHGVDCNV
ncbi:hypothetical protein NL676_016158 [Syzygium grande]|nr:hypothetical protein NL676_016158 [Syzygium grande]